MREDEAELLKLFRIELYNLKSERTVTCLICPDAVDLPVEWEAMHRHMKLNHPDIWTLIALDRMSVFFNKEGGVWYWGIGETDSREV